MSMMSKGKGMSMMSKCNDENPNTLHRNMLTFENRIGKGMGMSYKGKGYYKGYGTVF